MEEAVNPSAMVTAIMMETFKISKDYMSLPYEEMVDHWKDCTLPVDCCPWLFESAHHLSKYASSLDNLNKQVALGMPLTGTRFPPEYQSAQPLDEELIAEFLCWHNIIMRHSLQNLFGGHASSSGNASASSAMSPAAQNSSALSPAARSIQALSGLDHNNWYAEESLEMSLEDDNQDVTGHAMSESD